MNDNNFSAIRKYASIEEAKEVSELFLENGLEFKILDKSLSLDSSFGGVSYENKIELIIANKDFKRAEAILFNNAKSIIENIEEDYYLYSFSNQELYDILLKPDEWGELDCLLSKNILEERGKSIDEDLILSLRKQRMIELSKPEESQKIWIILGYILSVLGGLLGLMLGYFMWTAKKTLPNGQKVYTNSKNDRKHGQYIFYIGILIFPILLLLRVFINISIYTN